MYGYCDCSTHINNTLPFPPPPLSVYEVAGGFLFTGTGISGNAMCASYHWGRECFNDLGRFNTGCLQSSQLDYAGSFHTYGVEWTDTQITWDVDGVVFFTMDAKSVPGVTLPVPDALELKINTAIVSPHSNCAPAPHGPEHPNTVRP